MERLRCAREKRPVPGRARMKSRAVRAFVLAATALALCTSPALAADPPDPGTTQNLVYGSGSEARPYIVYKPSTYDAKDPVPLVVLAHGCMTTAEQQMGSTQFNKVAEREGFLIAYPDVDDALTQLPQPLKNCWRFYDPGSHHRDMGDAAALAGITREVMNDNKVDPERVYMSGMSAGGFMTSIMAAAYPDLYAAVGVMSAGAYSDFTCIGTDIPSQPVELVSQTARTEMGSRARIVPRLVIGGGGDQGIPPACADKALEQGLRTNNLVLGGSQTGPISLEPAAIREEAAESAGGYGSTVSTYRDPNGCLIGERWTVHEMDHFWSGGSTDPKWKNWNNPKGPSGAEIAWDFFSHFKKSDTSMPCAERNPDPEPAVKLCKKRKVSFRLPPKTRSVRATVNGKRVKARIRGKRVKVTLPATLRKRTVVIVKSRTDSGKRKKQRHVYRGCGPKR